MEGKKAEKKRLRMEAQAARPPLPPVEDAVKPLVWDTEKNGRNPYEDERLSDAAKKGELTSLPPFLRSFQSKLTFFPFPFPSPFLLLVCSRLSCASGSRV